MAKRNGSEGSALDPALSQKKRARRRLIGAAALALAAAIVLPMLLDSEPRQQFAEVEVEIPSRDMRLRPPSPDEGIETGVAPLAQGPDAQTPTALPPFAGEPAVSPPSVTPSPTLPRPAKQGTDNP